MCVNEKKVAPLFKAVIGALRFFYPRYTFEGLENLPDEPCLIIANHAQAHGPILCEVQFPIPRYTWCIGQMMRREEVADYAFEDFWSKKPRAVRWIFKIVSHLIARPAAFLMSNANAIGVYHDHRLLSTFRQTTAVLQDGYSVVIFPECYDEYNNIVWQFQEGFVDAARMYHRKTGKALPFVPLYIAPKIKKAVFGMPTYFDPAVPITKERTRICTYLMDAITAAARKLPKHTVVPYPNIPKKDYPTNL